MRVDSPAVGSLEVESSSASSSSSASASKERVASTANEKPAAVVAGSVKELNARAADADANRAEHVRRVAAEVRSGAYRVDLRALAERMISEDGGRLRRLLGEE